MEELNYEKNRPTEVRYQDKIVYKEDTKKVEKLMEELHYARNKPTEVRYQDKVVYK